MTWPILIQLMAQYGLPLAEKIFQKWETGNPPTAADFAELRAAASEHASDRMKAALAVKGISLDDPRAVEFLALASK